jgi:hypothetical protein
MSVADSGELNVRVERESKLRGQIVSVDHRQSPTRYQRHAIASGIRAHRGNRAKAGITPCCLCEMEFKPRDPDRNRSASQRGVLASIGIAIVRQ